VRPSLFSLVPPPQSRFSHHSTHITRAATYPHTSPQLTALDSVCTHIPSPPPHPVLGNRPLDARISRVNASGRLHVRDSILGSAPISPGVKDSSGAHIYRPSRRPFLPPCTVNRHLCSFLLLDSGAAFLYSPLLPSAVLLATRLLAYSHAPTLAVALEHCGVYVFMLTSNVTELFRSFTDTAMLLPQPPLRRKRTLRLLLSRPERPGQRGSGSSSRTRLKHRPKKRFVIGFTSNCYSPPLRWQPFSLLSTTSPFWVTFELHLMTSPRRDAAVPLDTTRGTRHVEVGLLPTQSPACASTCILRRSHLPLHRVPRAVAPLEE
jgi:hypothetical protein